MFTHIISAACIAKNGGGDKSTIGPNRVPTLGTCTIQEKKKFFKYFNLKSTLSSDEICNHYQADQQLLKNLKLMGYSIEE